VLATAACEEIRWSIGGTHECGTYQDACCSSLINLQTENVVARPLMKSERELSIMSDEMQQPGSELVAEVPACE
jgi:hypothetical protein